MQWDEANLRHPIARTFLSGSRWSRL